MIRSDYLDYINKIFGIGNEISVPIIISLIVFIIGGISKLIIKAIIDYFSRLQFRNSFRNIIKEIAKKSKIKSKHSETFYNTLDLRHIGEWKLTFTRVTYLNLIYQQDFTKTFNSFKRLFIYRNKKAIRIKAFNRIWSFIELLKLLESNIIIDFKEFVEKFNQYETAFNSYLDELRKQNDIFLKPYRGREITKTDFSNPEAFNYIVSRTEIIKQWKGIDNSIRRERNVIMNEIVRPLYQLNLNKTKIDGSTELNNILLDIIFEYEQMENLISVNKKIFYNYFWNYKISSRILNKLLIVIE